jgi:hypothetical protein
MGSNEYTLTWVFWLDVSTDEKSAKLLARIQRQLNVPLNNLVSERYWKDPRLMRITSETPLVIACDNHAEAVYETLLIIQRIAFHWEVDPLQIYEAGGLQWGGSRWHAHDVQSARFKVPGIHAVEFELRAV